MTTSTFTTTHVIFDYPGQPDRVVAIEDAFAFCDSADKLWTPSRVVCVDNDGKTFRPFAKGWWFHFDSRENHPMQGKLARIGAGAYGGTTVLKRNPQ